MTREERRLEREARHKREREEYDNNALNQSINLLKSLKENGEEYYSIASTYDGYTCDACSKWADKLLPLSEAKIGFNCPPFHSGCRCLITNAERISRMKCDTSLKWARSNRTGKAIYIPAWMTFEDFKREVLDNPNYKAELNASNQEVLKI